MLKEWGRDVAGELCVRVSDQSLERVKTVSGSQIFVLGDVVFAQDEELDWLVMGVSCRITGKRDDHRSWQMGSHSESQFWNTALGGGFSSALS